MIPSLFLATCCALAVQSAQTDKPTANDLAWMQGSWSCPKWDGQFEEHWMPASAGTLQGVGKHVKDGKTGFMEFMSIEDGPKGLTMYILIGSPAKENQLRAAFTLTSVKGKEATFEFPENDYPSKITYKKNADGTMTCTLTGTEDGKPSKDVFDFKPIKR